MDQFSDSTTGLRLEIQRGLGYVHDRLDSNSSETASALLTIASLVDRLIRKRVIDVSSFEAGKDAARGRIAENSAEKNLKMAFNELNVPDKYSYKSGVEIDCHNRVHLCRASCCRLVFTLSEQDVQEGIVRWNPELPYFVSREPDGCCSHLSRDSFGCSIWKNRPVTCRAYDCRRDQRIWIDFERMIPNPALTRPDWPQCLGTDHHGSTGNERHEP